MTSAMRGLIIAFCSASADSKYAVNTSWYGGADLSGSAAILTIYFKSETRTSACAEGHAAALAVVF